MFESTPTATDAPTVPDRYQYDPRATGEQCPHCGGAFEFHDEDVALEPTCAIFVCAEHFVTAGGDCPGATIRVYEDGFVSRSAFGAE